MFLIFHRFNLFTAAYNAKSSSFVKVCPGEGITFFLVRHPHAQAESHTHGHGSNLPSHHMFNRFSVIFLSKHFRWNKKGWWD